jgi:hypothetical protein
MTGVNPDTSQQTAVEAALAMRARSCGQRAA